MAMEPSTLTVSAYLCETGRPAPGLYQSALMLPGMTSCTNALLFLPHPEFITMMTGQPYKSPAAAEDTSAQASDEGMKNDCSDATLPLSPTSLTSPTAAALRGVSTISAKLKRQRLANQVYKDAWLATEPTLTGSITPSDLLWKVAPAVPGLVVEEADVAALVDPEDASKGITCECYILLSFSKTVWCCGRERIKVVTRYTYICVVITN